MTSVPEDPHVVAERVCIALDPLLTSHGFAAGQTGSSGCEIGVVYCSEQRDFRRRFPALMASIEHSDDGACTDLDIHVALNGSARLAEIHLEGHRLDELAHDVGRDDLRRRIEGLSDEPLDEGIAHLREVLTAILSTASLTPDHDDRNRNA